MSIMAKRSPISATAELLLIKAKRVAVFHQVAPLCVKKLMKLKSADMFKLRKLVQLLPAALRAGI